MKKCHACGEPWEGFPGTQPGREESCEKCGAYLHCCLNCRHHSPTAHHECMSSTTEYVQNKEGKNFCEEFEFTGKGQGGSTGSKNDMEDKWKNIFGS